MVLAQLGTSITRALHQMSNATIVDQSVLNACLNDIVRALLLADVNIRLAVFNELCRMLDAGNPSFIPKKGKTRSGKTTSCTKYAHSLEKRLETSIDPVKIAVEGVERFRKENHDLIIIDTSGRHKQEAALFEELHQVSEATATVLGISTTCLYDKLILIWRGNLCCLCIDKPDLVIFVMDSSIGQAANDQALAFKQSVAVGAVIITKMDARAKGGGALSAQSTLIFLYSLLNSDVVGSICSVAATKSPVIFIGTGEHMHEFEVFDAKSFVTRLLGMGDLSGLKDKIQEIVPEDQQSELLKKFSEGMFTLRMMYPQFQDACKAGPISQVFSMLPGFSVASIPEGQEKEAQAKRKRFLTIMDSMNYEVRRHGCLTDAVEANGFIQRWWKVEN
ncbi:Signal recognition particle subunit SRP54 2-like protein, partial [Drosera capensis]